MDKYDPWSGILTEAVFAFCSTENRLKCYGPDQVVLGCDMIFLIKHKVDWKLKRQWKQVQIIKDNIQENIKRDYYDVEKTLIYYILINIEVPLTA